MRVKEIIDKIEITALIGEVNPSIEKIAFDSREVEPGSLFIAIKGEKSDGHLYIGEAIERGAVAIIAEESPATSYKEIVIAITPNSRKALATAATTFYDNPSHDVKVVAITGTNGKTTTATLLYHLFTKLGYGAGLISTIENRVGEKSYPATQTTPDPITINSLLYQMREEGIEFCFMEVSSHALDQDRVTGIKFEGALFSNLTHDHLDYHGNFLSYLNSKKRLFDTLPASSFALTNIDDKNGKVMVQNCSAKVYSYSCHSPANFHCKAIEKSVDGMQLRIAGREIWTPFIGEHNGYNLLAVYSIATLLGLEQEELLTALTALPSVAGRLEYVRGGNNITAVIDYAHTTNALENVLESLKDVAGDSEIITLFGCGGDRDREKRPQMAKVAAHFSDRVVVTSDNPRSEDPEAIIAEIATGFSQKELPKVLFITDRREAIKLALTIATPGAIVLIAGKGHETYQEIKGVRNHFDDREEVQLLFNQMKL